MNMWTSQKLRSSFLNFFEKLGHRIVASSSLTPDDPTLLFTTAGMVQFKPYYSGTVPVPYKRAASCQKCLRATDLERVGKTVRHHTFFEMLGNFSFGDYFKEEAITWGWTFITEVLKINPDNLYVSIYREDEEAYEIWKDKVGIEKGRIYKLGKEDNFWGPAGKTGACGPSSEIYYDLGKWAGCGKPTCAPGCDCDRYLELWNLVFPQFDMQEDGKMLPLKNRGVDTGMGLERTLLVLQHKKSNFETDVLYPIIENLKKIFNRPYTKHKVEFNLIADHIRALTFSIADGVYPANFGRGYVLRKILRRALRFAQKLDFHEPFLYQLVPSVSRIFLDVYPEIKEKRELAGVLIKKEEERFLSTLSKNLPVLQEIIDRSKDAGMVSGKDMFKLYDTYGFPIDFVEEYAGDEDLKIDVGEFQRELEKQRERSRSKEAYVREISRGQDWNIFIESEHSKFVGYETLEEETAILRFRKNGDRVEMILRVTPFYAESGGQVGDRGIIIGEDFEVEVSDTQWSGEEIVHIGRLKKGDVHQGRIVARVDREFRLGCQRAHTATHILHTTLREFLGEHIRQEGSLVEPDRLRFDFAHFESLGEKTVGEIEDFANALLREDKPVLWKYTQYRDALAQGALAFFGEKYGETVRIVEIEDFSRELCGGTHAKRTGEIGIFRIIQEESSGSGIRRISALVGNRALKHSLSQERILRTVAEKIGANEDNLLKKFEKTIEERVNTERYIAHLEQSISLLLAEKLSPRKKGDYEVYVENFKGVGISILRKVSDRLSKPNRVLFLVGEEKGKPVVFSRIGEKVQEKISALQLVKSFGKYIKGGGGGNRAKAEGGGAEKSGVKSGLKLIQRSIFEKI